MPSSRSTSPTFLPSHTTSPADHAKTLANEHAASAQHYAGRVLAAKAAMAAMENGGGVFANNKYESNKLIFREMSANPLRGQLKAVLRLQKEIRSCAAMAVLEAKKEKELHKHWCRLRDAGLDGKVRMPKFVLPADHKPFVWSSLRE